MPVSFTQSRFRVSLPPILIWGLVNLLQSSIRIELTVIDIDDDNAVNKHYELLASLMRLVCAAVLSRGSQNQQTLEQGRKFLTENRLSILALFKKSAGIGTGPGGSRQSIDELAESYMLLMSVTGFLDVGHQLLPENNLANSAFL
jgi:hypothetical protein